MTSRQTLNMIGLATRAGKLASGAFQVNKAIESGAAQLVLMDSAASENTVNEISRACEARQIPVAMLDEGGLSQATGKPGRMVAAILDTNFSQRINDLIHGGV